MNVKVMQVRPNNKIGSGPTGTQAKLRILETTDLHVSLLPYDYFSDRPSPGTGLAQAASLVRALRAGADNCLLFDNGDFLQGNPLADWVARDTNFRPGDIHPMIAAMNSLGYDAGTLGNHEFDYGLEFLQGALAQAGFPITSANVLVQRGKSAGQDKPLLAPYVLLDRQLVGTDGQLLSIRIGVIGFAPPQLVDWNRIILQQQIATRSIVDAALHYVPLLRQAGADIIVALSHSGISETRSNPDTIGDATENASVQLASIDGIDVILAGHTHVVFPGPGTKPSPDVDPVNGTLHGKPAVMAGSNASHVGVIDLLLAHHGGRWTVVEHQARAEPVATRDSFDQLTAQWPVDAQVQAAMIGGHDAVLTLIRQPIGETTVPLHSYFALVAPDLSIQVVAEAQSAQAARLLQHTPLAGLPILSAVAPSKAGGLSGALNYIDISAGPLQIRHAAELSVFPNSFCILALSGADLHNWLEQSAGIFAQVTVGLTDQPLLNPDFPCYNFDVIDGVTYDIDPSRPSRTDGHGLLINPASQRIQNLRHNGALVTPNQRFIIATNSYRVGGGGGFAMAGRAEIIQHSPENTRDIVIRHLRESSPLVCAPRRIWRFAPLADTAAWFESAAIAVPKVAAITGQSILDAGPRPGRMQRFTLNF